MKHHIIGDIHGHGISLQKLLVHLGYELIDGVYQHPESHRVVFLGDFIDRGPTHRQVIDIVKPMIEQGHALSVMGNHEFNAICYHTEDGGGNYLRPHTDKNTKQHEAFLRAYPDDAERIAIVEWFKTLPLWLEFDDFRVIHACWYENKMNVLKPYLNEDNCLADEGFVATSKKGSQAYDALEVLIKGVETELPGGQSFPDNDGNIRHHIRTKWWDAKAKTFNQASIIQVDSLEKITGETPQETRPGYPADAKPLLLGHYWFKGVPEPILHNLACLDYSIAKGRNGKLVAYEFSGSGPLCSSNFIWCE